MKDVSRTKLAQMLFTKFGTPPEEMGFPICSSREEFDRRMKEKFSPNEFWLGEADEIIAMLAESEKGGSDGD